MCTPDATATASGETRSAGSLQCSRHEAKHKREELSSRSLRHTRRAGSTHSTHPTAGILTICGKLASRAAMKPMIRSLVLSTILITATALHAQESVCALFSHLGSADGSQVVVTGDLIIAKDIAVLGAADCDNRYTRNRRSPQMADSAFPESIILRRTRSASAVPKGRGGCRQPTKPG